MDFLIQIFLIMQMRMNDIGKTVIIMTQGVEH